MSDIILATNKLCKTFSNEGVQQHVLKNLDVEIKRGDFTVIMGSSGAGKSTLMYALSGMDQPTLGEITFDGVTISHLKEDELASFRRKHCGFVFQQVYLLNQMSLMDNVLSTGLLVTKNKKELVKRANALFDQVNINEETRKKFPTQLSGGEAQRAGIVRALINEPTVVFADEPTGALNSTNSEMVLNTLSEVNRQGQSVIMVTHDLKSARRGNRIIYLKDGVICGECQLGEYIPGDKDRHTRLKAFLTEMGW
ncbi:cell division transporter, ATP-binding protein FtsE [Lachnospiraceae bacterium KM106-2]|nr:cell division transporter, ATP-binding protein FtsE [Lachnospiraceae bacterium KM106-2]